MTHVARDPKDFGAVFAANFNARDLDGLVGNYTADAVMDLGGGNVLVGRDQIRQALVNFLAPGLPIAISQRRVLVSGGTAYVSMDFAIEGNGPDGKSVKIGGTTVDVLRREADGVWRQCLDLPFGTATP